MAKKIAMIGAGSVVFCKTLMSDIMATPALADSEFALMSPTESKLRRMEAFGQRMVRDNGLPGKVWATTDRREAIQDADFVVVMIQVGGFHAYGVDYEIPLQVRRGPVHRRYAGAGRHLPRAAAYSRAGGHRARHGSSRASRARSCCSTPTRWRRTAWRWAASRNVPFIGLCHGVQTTLDLIAGYCEVPKDEITLRLRRHQPHGLVPETGTQGPRPLPAAARKFRAARSTTRTKRCAARCSGSSATS